MIHRKLLIPVIYITISVIFIIFFHSWYDTVYRYFWLVYVNQLFYIYLSRLLLIGDHGRCTQESGLQWAIKKILCWHFGNLLYSATVVWGSWKHSDMIDILHLMLIHQETSLWSSVHFPALSTSPLLPNGKKVLINIGNYWQWPWVITVNTFTKTKSKSSCFIQKMYHYL